MNTYLAQSTVQVTLTLASSLIFTCLGIYYQKSGCKKNSLVNVWFLISVIFGFCSFVMGYTLEMTTLSIGITEPTTAITVIWFTLLYSAFFQFTSFLTAFGLNLYFTHNHGSYSDEVGLLNDSDSNTSVYKANFTWKMFLITVVIWVGLTSILSVITYTIAYFVGAL